MNKPALALLSAALIAVAACGGDDDGAEPTPGSGYRVTLGSHDTLSIGAVRFVFLLEDPRGHAVTNGNVRLRFYFIDPVRENRKTVKNEVSAIQIELDREYSLVDQDGESVVIGPGPTGIYANDVAFDQPGDWVVDVTGTAGSNNLGVIEVPLTVSETASGPRTGQQAPLAVDGPVIVAFGDAGACGSAVCGPLIHLAEEETAALAEPVPLIAGEDPGAWGVGEDQALFFIDQDGFVQGRLDAAASRDEVAQRIALISPLPE